MARLKLIKKNGSFGSTASQNGHSRRQVLSMIAKASLLSAFPLSVQPALATDTGPGNTDRASVRLVLLGTAGGPPPRADRAPPASALIVNGETYLIDCGENTAYQLDRAGIRHNTVGKVFITHHHDDHNAGLGPLLSLSWTNGRQVPIDIFGPVGTEKIVGATLDYAKSNIAIRTVDEGRQLSPTQLWRARDIAPPSLVYEDRNVRVTCVENTHFDVPGEQSLSYRFETETRSVVFSGDTGYSEALIGLAKGADVLVHEVIHVAATRPILQGLFQSQGGGGRPQAEIDALIKHVLEKHTSTEDVGKVAAAAGVKSVVLNHLIPGGLEKPPLRDEDYISGVRKTYDGPVIVGRDLQSIPI